MFDKQLNKILDDAWLNLQVDESQLFNPMQKLVTDFEENAHLAFTYLLMQPEFIPFVCKEILNMEIFPLQSVFLYQSWRKKFPMWIGARGMSKCCVSDTKIITNKGIKKIGDILYNVYGKQKIDYKVLTENNTWIDIDYGWYNGYTNNIYLQTNMGYNFEGTLDHPLRVIRNGNIQWVELQDIKINDYIIIDRQNNLPDIDNNISEDLAYCFGLLVGDGNYTCCGRIGFTTTDKELIIKLYDTFYELYNKEFIKVPKSKYDYRLHCVKIWHRLFNEYGFVSPVCHEKDIPDCIWSSSPRKIAKFLSGLFDTDGYISKKGQIGYSSKSKNLVYNIQFLLSRFGIISKVYKSLNKKYNRYYYHLRLVAESTYLFQEKIGFNLTRKKLLLETYHKKEKNTNVDIIPHELVLDKLLKLREKYISVREPQGHGYVYNRSLISAYRLKTYQVSYRTLGKILELTKVLKDTEEWQFLMDIFNKHYFYDKVSFLKISNDDTYDIHLKDDHSFISNGFISHNTTLLGLYAVLRALMIPGRQIVICGSVFRQSKLVFEHVERIYKRSPRFREICHSVITGKDLVLSRSTDMWRFNIGESSILAIPIGASGENVRGLRANDLFVEEFAAHNRDVFETVLSGFLAVSADPVAKLKKVARDKLAKKLGIVIEEVVDPLVPTNQLLLCGTAYYQFNHFYEYWKKWRTIIQSGNDAKKLEQALKDSDLDINLNPKDYLILRIPVDLIPEGFMDKAQIARSKASMHSGNFACEFGATFQSDTTGFFKRSLIESCIANDKNRIRGKDGIIIFHPMMRGKPDCKYVMAIDPASEIDNFAVIILEVHEDHRRIVYCWTITKKEQKERLKSGIIQENDFFRYCILKIRELMESFNIQRIAVDTQGGGYSIMEGLCSSSNLLPGQVPVFEIIDPDKYKDSDSMQGAHIIECIQFANQQWVITANDGLRKDLEDKTILFPYFDPLTYEFAGFSDKNRGMDFDTLEDCVIQIEELKDELSTIVVSETPSGRRKWDTPDSKMPGKKVKSMRKDRYSALLMANAAAKNLIVSVPVTKTVIGGFSYNVTKENETHKGRAYNGPQDLVEKLDKLYSGV